MLATAISAALLVVALLIVASLLLGAWHARRRYKRQLTSQSEQLPYPLDRQVTALARLPDGKIVAVEKPRPQVLILPSSWYARRRTLVSIGLLVMVLLALGVQGGLAGGGTLQNISKQLGLGITFFRQNQASDIHPEAQPLPETASTRLVRIDSAARSQYYTDYQWHVWSYSSCSGIAMEMVMNSYGRHLIAADVLQKELDLGVWSVQLGLLREDGIAMTAATYGFDTVAGHTRTLDNVISTANKGAPVIVSVRDSYYFPGGHIFVVRGGDSQYVYIADSSPGNFQRMTRDMFVGMWQGFSAVLTPN